MTIKGKTSEVGEKSPTENSKMELDNLVDDVLGPPPGGPKSTLPKEEKGMPTEEDSLTEESSDEPEESSETNESEDQDDESESESSDDDVIPASKHKKTLEKMQKRIDAIVAERDALKAEQEKSGTQDSKLEALTETDLLELRDNVDEAMMDAKVSSRVDGVDNSAKINELKGLKRNIDKTLKDIPRKFQATQMKHLKAMIDEVSDVDPNISNMKGELWATAIKVYQKMPSLHRSETGQAEALAIATEYFLEKQSLDSGREKASTLSKKVATLKRKTTLDSKTRNANQDIVSSKKLKDKAIRGTYFDKLEYVSKTLVPDDFLSPQ